MRISLPQFPSEERLPNHIAEVIESNSADFSADCIPPDQLDYPSVPPLGSWVTVHESEDVKIIGIVIWAEVGVPDAFHRPTVLGLTVEQIKQEQPQIFGLIRSCLKILSVGMVNGEKIFYGIPPKPPQLHQPVYLASPHLIEKFCQQGVGWLEILINSDKPAIDAVIAASLRHSYQCLGRDRAWLIQAGRQLNIWLRDDYDRLRRILGQLNLD